MIMRILIITIINPIMNKEKRSPKTLTEIKQAEIFKKIIMTPHHYPPPPHPPLTTLPRS